MSELAADPFKLSEGDFANYLRGLTFPSQVVKDGIEWMEKNKKTASEVPLILCMILNEAKSVIKLPEVSGVKNPSYRMSSARFIEEMQNIPNERTAIAMGLEWFRKNVRLYKSNPQLATVVLEKLKKAVVGGKD